MKNPDQLSQTIYYQMADLLDISAIYRHNEQLYFRAQPRIDSNTAMSKVKSRLVSSGFEVTIKEDLNGLLIAVRQSSRRRWPTVNIILFLATLLTMFFAPFFFNYNFDYFKLPGAFRERFEFTLALITILLFHEFGHYLAGRRRGVLMSLPYFIPAPNPLFGTFGAIIKSKSPFTNRRDLIEVGAAGPIAGFVITIIVLCLGFQSSEIVKIDSAAPLKIGVPLLLDFLSWLMIGPIREGYDLVLSPLASAGWVGLLVTMINLLPLGQLDGGHIIYGLMGRRQHQIGRLFLVLMMILGFWWPGWWLFGVLVFLFGINHPPTINDSIKLPLSARIIGVCAIIIFIISFIPAPFMME